MLTVGLKDGDLVGFLLDCEKEKKISIEADIYFFKDEIIELIS